MHRGPLYVIVILLACALAGPVGAADSPHAFTTDTLPAGWKIQQEFLVDDAQLAGFSKRLGGTLVSLSNQVVSVNGFDVRVNVLTAADDASAEALHATMGGIRPEPFVRRSGLRVYEVAGDNVLAARRVFGSLGLASATPVRWKVQFEIALIDDLDYTRANEVFNLFLKRAAEPASENACEAAIRTLTKDWTFGTTLRLDPGSGAGNTWHFEARSVGRDLHGGRGGEHTFSDPPTRCGVPYVAASGVVTTRACFDPVPGETTPQDLAPTPFWPVEDESVRARVRRVTAGLDPADPRARLRSLLAHVNESVRYGGAMGTRDGVLLVLARGYGRCWDKSDVLVTLCRAAGLPARQVAGWVPPLQAGHVWLEVHLEGEGWLPVDATTPWLGTSEDYLPFFRTSDGRMPIVYLALPRIERVAER